MNYYIFYDYTGNGKSPEAKPGAIRHPEIVKGPFNTHQDATEYAARVGWVGNNYFVGDDNRKDFVTITAVRYKELRDSHELLQYLRAHGVDSWDGYNLAQEAYNKDRE